MEIRGNRAAQARRPPALNLPSTASKPASLPAQFLELQQLVGNRAVTLAIQRWYEPKGAMPRSACLPVSGKQTAGLRWEQNRKAPTEVYRFVDGNGQGWESPGTTKQFAKSDWNLTVGGTEAKGSEGNEEKNIQWYDATAPLKRWRQEVLPDYRTARPDERPVSFRNLHGYSSAAAVPVYVKMKFRRKTGPSPLKADRAADLRALDRLARVLSGELPADSSPHLATAVLGGELAVAGNTGKRSVTEADRDEANERLAAALDLNRKLPSGRSDKDARKLRALASGDYAAHHAVLAQPLGQVADAMQLPARWGNVGAAGGAAEHGEMTVLEALWTDMQAHPGNLQQPITVNLGGLKLACKACWLALNAFNTRLAGPIGYRVVVSGTHRRLFPGWKAPNYLWNNAHIQADLRAKVPKGWLFDAQGTLGRGDGSSDPKGNKSQDPEESDSDWEEI
ncbi:MAG: hypothetical protein QOG82_1083 [Actinomycetota bacterium]|jgi:hypothetical protein|nr:hypothetical protein [Actinomycetota bacterium]